MATETEKLVDLEIGRRLRDLRCMRGLKLRDLSAMSGISYQQIQKYENGTNRVAASRLYTFSCILHVSPSYFFKGLSGIFNLSAARACGTMDP